MKVYYFGCWGSIGHFLWTTDADIVPFAATPWGKTIDGGLCPGKRHPRDQGCGEVLRDSQHEGWAALHHRDGWTALAFWDRSVDTRPNSNSAFLAEGTRTLPEMMALAWSSFPAVMARLKVAIRVDGVSEGRS